MPPAAGSPSFVLVWGDDDFAVQRRARQVFDQWVSAQPGGDEEILDATAANSDEALRALRRLREALQTLPFFGGTKTIWFRGCNFLGEDRVSEAQAVVEGVADLAKDLSTFAWNGVRLLLSAGKIDRRRGFYRTVEKCAEVEHFPGLSADDRDWRDKAETLAAGELRGLGRRPDGEALAILVENVGPNARLLASEIHKLVAYVGDRTTIASADVEAIVTRGRHARAFALADALGERQLAKALRHLDEELWSMQSDRQKSEIGLLYALISKVRAMLLAKEMLREGWIRPAQDYRAFAAQLKQLPADRLPSDRRYNPAEINAFVLFQAARHAAHYTSEELVRAMDELLRCNRQLVGGSQDGGFVLQHALTRILGGETARPLDARRRRA
ncbi:MAG: DNA polymerase III subunit delta [Verrucomicrobiales bacterium]|nr:DNA polymerase III subunit delta [Verrucomicrobiales bacterium]